jgi:hypothetical protein
LFRLGSEPASRSPAAVNNFIGGYLLRLDDAVRVRLLSALIERFQAMGNADEADIIRVLKAAPFKKTTWSIVDALPSLSRCKTAIGSKRTRTIGAAMTPKSFARPSIGCFWSTGRKPRWHLCGSTSRRWIHQGSSGC